MIPLPLKPNIVLQEGHRAIFEIGGLYPGYGQTIGNSLRRVLLSSLEGAVITSVKISGAGHEFSTLEGIMEDIVDLTLNLKQVRLRLYEPGPFTITLAVKGERTASAKDFQAPSQVEIINPDIHVATLTSKKANLEIEAVVESGRGYVPVETRTKEKVEVGTIALDAAFSPVLHVNYEIENMRVADRTDYNLLRIDIETDGSLSPQEALLQAAQILVDQFSAMVARLPDSGAIDTPPVDIVDIKEDARPASEATDHAARGEPSKEKDQEAILKEKVDTLEVSSRTLNALREAGIKTIGGLTRKREATLREIEGMGDKGIQEIKRALEQRGLALK